MSLTRTRLLLALGLVYLTLFVSLDFLRFPPAKDEVHFWPTAVSFSRAWIPSLEQLRGYGELNTPLPFIVYGTLEHLLHGGIAAGRVLNVLLSFLVAAAIVTAGDDPRRAARAAVGLLLFPYFLGLSPFLYTDIITTLLVLLGLIAHLERKPLRSAACWTLAIAARQYAVAFPLAIAGRELAFSRRDYPRWIAPAAAAATLAFWFWCFGGPAPSAELARQAVDADRLQHLHPSHAVYLLVCVGVFYVIPELLLFREARPTSLNPRRSSPVLLALAAATVPAALFFAPLGNQWGPPTMGVFDVLCVTLLPGSIARALLYAGLAALAAIRFSDRSAAAFLVAANGLVLMFGYTMWEKYALPLLVCLWYLKARLVESSSPLKES